MRPPVTFKKPEWLTKLEAESWEAELLVSGVAIFGALQLPGLIYRGIDFVLITFPGDFHPSFYYIFWFLIISSSLLILNFIIHFALRALWIGMIGLVSVFPKGINPDSESYSRHFIQQVIRDFPNPTTFNQNLDRICSQIFAFSFAFALIFIGFVTSGLVVLLLAFLLNLIFPDVQASYFLIPSFLLFTVPGFISGILNSKGLRDKEWVQKIHYPVFVRAYGKFIFNVFFEPVTYISYIFGTNFKVKRYVGFLVLYFFGLMFISAPILIRSNALLLMSDNFENNGYRADIVAPENYADQRQTGEAVLEPVIPSEVISESYFRLFIPLTRREEPRIEAVCSPFSKGEDLSSRARRQARRAHRLQCVAKNYLRIQIDDTDLSGLDFNFYDHPDSPRNGVVTYLPTDSLARGRHILRVVYPYRTDEGHIREINIPFWFYPKSDD